MWVSIEAPKKKKHESKLFYFYIIPILFLCILWFVYRKEIKDHLFCKLFNQCYEVEDETERSLNITDEEEFFETVLEELNDILETKILITSIPRSGSSFLGEIFNRHKDSFYIYEPLHTEKILTNLGIVEVNNNNPLKLLEDISKCNLKSHKEFFNFLSNPQLSNPHFRLTSTALSSPPFCKHQVYDSNYTEIEYEKDCYTINSTLAEIVCKQKKHTVIKELIHRLPSQQLSSTLNLLTDKSTKIIYLLRDPRAVLFSMSKVGWIGNHENAFARSFKSAAYQICKSLEESYRAIERVKQFLNDKLIVVRYEDLVTQPEEVLNQLFWFNNVKMDDNIIDWVIANTNGQFSNVNANKSFSLLLRNITYSLNSWRNYMSFNETLQVQKRCSLTMKQYGYQKFSTFKDMQNFSISTFTDDMNVSNALRVS